MTLLVTKFGPQKYPKTGSQTPLRPQKKLLWSFWWFHWVFYGKTTKPQNENNTPAINNIGSTPPFFLWSHFGVFWGSFLGCIWYPIKRICGSPGNEIRVSYVMVLRSTCCSHVVWLLGWCLHGCVDWSLLRYCYWL